jgi:dihydroxyacid dehydratase/phosphogluconate dehydratase
VSVEQRSIRLCISDEEMARRKAAWVKPEPRYQRGYGAMFQEHIAQAEDGCDFDFLEAGAPTPEPEIH